MELNYPEFYDRFAAFLRSREGRRVVVISHARPDGDCIGSQVALTRVLRALNIDAIAANPDPVPRRIQFAVGDTPYDILAAHRIPVPVIALRCGGFPEELLTKAEYVFDDLTAMTRELDRIDEYFRE